MTKRAINKELDISDKNFKKLSIQVSLNGLSFCIADTVSHKVLLSGNEVFPEELNPQELLKQVKLLLTNHGLDTMLFDEVVVIHKNNLFSLVPKPLFEEKELESYLKFNIKLLATDAIAFDELENHEMVNVYVPYMNINNYIYELFGEFTYMHNGTVLLQSLMNNQSQEQETICYVHVSKKQMDITILNQRKLLLYNSFIYETKEDFTYYLLFVLEQLNLDTKSTPVKLFGAIEEDDDLFQLCYSYIQHLTIFAPSSPQLIRLGEPAPNSIDFTLINTL